MPEIRALIVDDEPLARRGIRQLLSAHPDVLVVGEARDGREALRALATLDPTLVFLDIQMPGLDGFGVLRARGLQRMPAVVFVTAHDQFAVRAFEANALDYLVKPVGRDRFDATLTRVRRRFRMADDASRASRLAALLAAQHPTGSAGATGAASPDRLMVPTASGRLLIDFEEIDWIEAQDYYAGIHAGGRRYLIRESLATLEKRLGGGRFARVHRGAIVRLDRVRELRADADGGTVAVLRNGTRVPVSRRRRERLMTLLRRSEG